MIALSFLSSFHQGPTKHTSCEGTKYTSLRPRGVLSAPAAPNTCLLLYVMMSRDLGRMHLYAHTHNTDLEGRFSSAEGILRPPDCPSCG